MTSEAGSPLARERFPLRGHSVVITGVSRRAGIGFATACKLAAYGANLFCHHFAPHDSVQPWGADSIDEVLDGIREHSIDGTRVVGMTANFMEPDAPADVMGAALQEFGRIDGLVCNHAQSGSDGSLAEIDSDELDSHFAVNTRSSILLAKEFAARHEDGDRASIVFMTSGQYQGPMPSEVAYAASKAALAGVTLTIADELADRGIRVNAVNPGPVDTGYLTSETFDRVAKQFPFGRFGAPSDPAKLISWLLTDEAAWITGQVLNSEGGFARWR